MWEKWFFISWLSDQGWCLVNCPLPTTLSLKSSEMPYSMSPMLIVLLILIALLVSHLILCTAKSALHVIIIIIITTSPTTLFGLLIVWHIQLHLYHFSQFYLYWILYSIEPPVLMNIDFLN